MNVLVVFCHPVPDSFGAAVRDATVGALAEHEVKLVDLYEGHDLPRNFENADSESLAWADGVVLVYPTWWSSLPAPLMAWVEAGLEMDAWRHLRRVVAVTTHGSSLLMNTLTGGIGRRIVRRGLPRLMAEGAIGRFLAVYGMDQITDGDRHRFLESLSKLLPQALA